MLPAGGPAPAERRPRGGDADHDRPRRAVPPARRSGGSEPPHRGHRGRAPLRGPHGRDPGRATATEGWSSPAWRTGPPSGWGSSSTSMPPPPGTGSPWSTWPARRWSSPVPPGGRSTEWSSCCSRRPMPGCSTGSPIPRTSPGWPTGSTPQPWACFEEKLELVHEDELAAIPQFHIVCTSTLATRDPELMEDARRRGRLWDVDTGHDLMITEPDGSPTPSSRWRGPAGSRRRSGTPGERHDLARAPLVEVLSCTTSPVASTIRSPPT